MNADASLAADRHPQLTDSWTDTLDRLRAFVTSRVDDPELAADITQDVIVRSIASGALERVDNPAAWLYRSARNAVIDHYRTRRAHAPIDDLDAWPDPGDRRPTERRHTRTVTLPPADARPAGPAAREALVRVDVNGQTQHSAAREVGLSLTGMKSRGTTRPPRAQEPARTVLHRRRRYSRSNRRLPPQRRRVRLRIRIRPLQLSSGRLRGARGRRSPVDYSRGRCANAFGSGDLNVCRATRAATATCRLPDDSSKPFIAVSRFEVHHASRSARPPVLPVLDRGCRVVGHRNRDQQASRR